MTGFEPRTSGVYQLSHNPCQSIRVFTSHFKNHLLGEFFVKFATNRCRKVSGTKGWEKVPDNRLKINKDKRKKNSLRKSWKGKIVEKLLFQKSKNLLEKIFLLILDLLKTKLKKLQKVVVVVDDDVVSWRLFSGPTTDKAFDDNRWTISLVDNIFGYVYPSGNPTTDPC